MIAGLQLWLDAAQISGLNDGDAVGTWRDLSGNGYHATETGTARPTYKSNILNGRPVVRFDGMNNFMQLTNSNSMPLNDNTLTIFAVYNTTSTARQVLFGSSNGGSICLEMFTSTGERAVSTPGVYVARTLNVSHVADSDYQVLTYRRTGDGAGTHGFYVNGVLEPLLADTASGFTSTAVKQLGRRSAATLMFTGDIAELIIYDSGLSETQRLEIERYLCEKWGLTHEGDDLAEGDFSLAILGDTHTQSIVAPLTWAATVADQVVPDVALVIHSGDAISDATIAGQWTTLNNGLAALDSANKPYCMAIGNHEYDSAGTVSPARAITYWDAAGNLPQTRYIAKSWWNGGFYAAGSENAYYLFTAGGRNWIVIWLEFGPRQAVVDWANTILTTYSTRKAIIITHAYLNEVGVRHSAVDAYNPHAITGDGHPNVHDGSELWSECLKLHSNICLVMCGHELITTPQRSRDFGDFGNIVNQMIFNWHAPGLGGYIRVIKFKALEISVLAYNPTTNVWLTDAANKFSVSY